MKKIRNLLITLTFALVVGGLTVSLFVLPDKDISSWERRKLQQMPEISFSSLSDGSFMKNFETYLADQFPLRDTFRSIKARFHFGVLGQKDNNDIFVAQGSAGKLEPKINENSVNRFTTKISSLYTDYIKDTDCKTLFAIVPDKNLYLTEGTNYPCLDYDELYSLVYERLGFAEALDLRDTLSASSYYATDSHWKQEEIIPVANLIRNEFGLSPLGEFEKKNAGDFYGVYYGQSALPLDADELNYLTNEEIESCVVTGLEITDTAAVYNFEKLSGFDRYDIFLSGPMPLIEISNPKKGEKGKELILFRDSFSSSLAPLLLSGYSKVTLIDTRYMPPEMIGDYVTFSNQDVLFIYSVGIINNSSSLR